MSRRTRREIEFDVGEGWKAFLQRKALLADPYLGLAVAGAVAILDEALETQMSTQKFADCGNLHRIGKGSG